MHLPAPRSAWTDLRAKHALGCRGLQWGTLFPRHVSIEKLSGAIMRRNLESAIGWNGSMAKDKKTAASDVSKSQAKRLLEVARAAQAGGSGRNFSQAMGKITLRRNGRKTAKGGVGGGAE
jgi:hypothetical protein